MASQAKARAFEAGLNVLGDAMQETREAAPDCGLAVKDLSDIRKEAKRARFAMRNRERPWLSVAERIRFKWRLFWKYGPECAYCHRAYDWRYGLTIDHVQPKSKGGAIRDVSNMVLACTGCNRAKGNAWL